MAKKAAIEVGDHLVLQVDIVRVDDDASPPTVTFAMTSGQRFTIPQESGDIVEVVKAPKERGRALFDKPD